VILGWGGLITLVALQAGPPQRPADLLLLGGRVLDGAGSPWVIRDVAITGARISFVGHAASRRIRARDTLDVRGKLVTPGLWDVHSHENVRSEPYRHAVPFLYQGITTVVLGVDGFGDNEIAKTFAEYRRNGMAVNALHFVGHGPARTAAMNDRFARAATPDEIERMKGYVAKGMREGAVGFSTGLAYNPGYFATTDEVVALSEVAARFGGVYDTHDRDMGVTLRGIGFLNSVREAIEIAERGGTPLVFSHFGSLSAKAHADMPAAIRLIEAARARGVNVMAAQHVYTASEGSVVGHLFPRWAQSGGTDSLLLRLADQASWALIAPDVAELLAIRGGPDKIIITEGPVELSRHTVAEVAARWATSPTEALRRMVRDARGGRLMDMNADIYSMDNVRLLAVKDWMMTCTDGYTPGPEVKFTHPRTFAGFTRKLTQLVRDERVITLPFAIRGMTGLPAAFYGIGDRGLIKPGFYADLAVFDEARIQDRADYRDPFQYSEGTVHVLVNGRFAFRDGKPTGTLAGMGVSR